MKITCSKDLGLEQFLIDFPRVRIIPSSYPGIELSGNFEFSAQPENEIRITESYSLQIQVPAKFPSETPVVFETGGKIPRTGDFHVNPDGSLCLGSPLRLLFLLSKSPSLQGFTQLCLVPYLYAVSYKIQYGKDFVFGQLAHGTPGELDDYMNLFGLRSITQAALALKYLGMKKRRANKLPCPCGCGRRLGVCRFNFFLRDFRMVLERKDYRKLFANLGID
jgi:hypothetical protein